MTKLARDRVPDMVRSSGGALDHVGIGTDEVRARASQKADPHGGFGRQFLSTSYRAPA